MKKKGRVFRLIVLLTGVALMTILFLSKATDDPSKTTNTEETEQENTGITAGQIETVRDRCTILQTMRFLRCSHSVTRRIEAPDEITGMNFSEVQQRYSEWQIGDFESESITMSREMMLFCPIHWVLTVNDAGEAVLTKNEYGDGMAIKKTYGKTLDDFPEEKREKLLMEIGFDTEAEAESWLNVD